MGRIILVTGGSRSGKSRFAESLCLLEPPPHFYLATCPRISGDADLETRIARHQEQRAGRGFVTIEEPLSLERALQTVQAENGSCLLECLGLWINNLIFQGIGDRICAEEELQERVRNICATWKSPGTLIAVAQEPGWGILPADLSTRLWMDLLGAARNTWAQIADEVWLVVSGIPVKIKPSFK